MCGKIKVLVLAFVATVALLIAGGSSGQVSQDPCGGHYAGEKLKALFSESYVEAGVTYNSSITNDVTGLYYEYWVPGGDCVFLFRNGHIVVRPHTAVNGRYVNMAFITGTPPPKPATVPPCGNTYFMDGTGNPFGIKDFYLRTGGGYTGSRNANGDLVLLAQGINPNMTAMLPGDTIYCDLVISFWVYDDANTSGYDESVLDSYMVESRPVSIYCELFEGKTRWRFRPIPEAFLVRIETWKGKNLISVTETQSDNSMYRKITSNGRSSCNHGWFYFPFELIVERLK
jgi:hypothetical protein